MRAWILAAGVASCVACAPDVWLAPDLRQANARPTRQTPSAQVALYGTDVNEPYDVLGDLQVIVRQQGALGEEPTHAMAEAALREQAGRMGAHAVIMVGFGEIGTSLWSYSELRANGRAIRFR